MARKSATQNGPKKFASSILKNKVISIYGRFHDLHTAAEVERLSRIHRGTFTRKVTDETTHLICSVKDFVQKVKPAPSK
jgi:hypothetical protein